MCVYSPFISWCASVPYHFFLFPQLLTDLLYTRFTSRYANLLANQSIPVYYFVLDYYGTNSIMNIIGDTDTKSKK